MPYFDHNATTPLLPAVRAAWLSAADDAWQNPGSPYRAAARVHRLLENARQRIAAIVGGPQDSIVFTSGATEANNAILTWAGRSLPAKAAVAISPAEHPSALEPARAVFGDRLQWLSVYADGRVDPSEVAEKLAGGGTGMVVTMAANNETGVLNPVKEIAAACAEHGVVLLIDASQWIGRMPSASLPAHAFLVGCAHKFGGPKGAGFLRIPPGGEGFAGARGGAQEHGHRGGTEDFPAVAAMTAALEFCEEFTDEDRAERAAWRDALVAVVAQSISNVAIVGRGAGRLWNTVSLTFPRHANTRWVAQLDRRGFQVSTGSACASGSANPSHVLAAMGVAPEDARRTIRISAGWKTSEADWMALAGAVAAVWSDLEREKTSSTDSHVIEI